MTAKAAEYLLKLTADNRSMIGNERAAYCVSLIEKTNMCTADELYRLAADEIGLYTFAENAEGKEEETFWQAFVSVYMCIVCAEYRREGQKYLPEDLEAIREEQLNGFFTFLAEVRPDAKECFEYFQSNVCL